jgi:hypothetical protein
MTEAEHPSYPVIWLSREDMLYCRPDLSREIEAFTEAEMAGLARKVGYAVLETYLMSIEILLNDKFGSRPDEPGDQQPSSSDTHE